MFQIAVQHVWSQSAQEDLTIKPLHPELVCARTNRAKVIEGVLFIEHQLELIAAAYFFPHDFIKEQELLLVMLRTSWCTFAAKMGLMEFVVDSLRLPPTSKDIKKIVKQLHASNGYRNAFTHGLLHLHGDAVFLKYFKSKPIVEELTEKYLKEVEDTINETANEAVKIRKSVYSSLKRNHIFKEEPA